MNERDVSGEHRPRYGRVQRGSRTWGTGGGHFYGTTVRCSCGGFKKQINQAPSKGGREIAEALFAAHLREDA